MGRVAITGGSIDMKLQQIFWIPLAIILAGCGNGASDRTGGENRRATKPFSPEQQQFLTALASFHSAVSSLATGYDAAQKASALAQGLQNSSPAVMNMKGSDFIRQAESFSSAIDRVPEAKARALSSLSNLAQDYAILQEKNLVHPQIQELFSLAPPSDASWADSDMTVASVRDTAQALLKGLSAPGAWEITRQTVVASKTEQAKHTSTPSLTTSNDVNASAEARQAAERGEAVAQFNLGIRYANGEGVEKDEAEAVKWVRKAAEQNYARAQFTLGCYYLSGKGVEKDRAEAVKWYRKAAEQNFAPAQLILGCCYEIGSGVEKDLVEGHMWLSLGTAKECDSDATAVTTLARIASQLTSLQIAEAERRASEFRQRTTSHSSAGSGPADSAGRKTKPGAGVSLASATWPRHQVEPGIDLVSIAWSGKEYVAIGSQGVIVRSEDLQRWNRVQSGVDVCLNTVQWLGSRFVVGGCGVILASVDGKSWTPRYANTNRSFFEAGNETGPPPRDGYRVDIYGFASNGKLLLAAGSGGAMLTSSNNGDTWSVAARKPPIHLYRIAWSGNRFVGFGAVDSGKWLLPLEGAVLTSTDGVKWATKPDSHDVNAIVWTGSEFAAVNTKGDLLLSKDGSEWLRRKLPVDGACSIAWTGREYAIGANGVILIGSDGVNWKEHRLEVPEWWNVKVSWIGAKLLVAARDSVFEAVP